MNEKIRILFSIETNDKWIFDAYRGFYDLLNQTGRCEIFCTVCKSCLSEEQLKKYNVIDYEKTSQKSLNSLVKNSSSKLTEGLIKQAEKFSLWANPKRLLERFILFNSILNFLKPDIVIVWNGNADVRGMIGWFLAKQNIPFFYAEKGMLPESWYIDEEGINAECSLDNSFSQLYLSDVELKNTSAYIHSIIESGSSAWEQPERAGEKGKFKESLGIDFDSKVIFFPGQVDEDVNVTRYSDFNNIAEAVRLVLDSMPEKTYLIVKPHPKSKEESKAALEKLKDSCKNLRVVNDVNIWDVIEACDLVVSINSTVAFEAMLRGKQAFVLGDGVLSKTGLCKKVNLEELGTEIRKFFENRSDYNIEYSKVLSFVNFLKENYYIFRNENRLPQSVLSRIEKRAGLVSGKFFGREDIINLLYNQDAADSFNTQNSDPAIEYFSKAKKAFDKDNFSEAVEHIRKYKSLFDYNNLKRVVKPDKDDINISVVIVTYNRKSELQECLETLSNQDLNNYEIIIVDNGGCDYESIKQYVDQYIKCPINFNLSEGRNIGVHFARGKIVAFLDDDALVEPGYVESIKSAFEKYDIYGLRGRTFPKNPTSHIIGSNIYDLGSQEFPTYCNQEGNSAWRRDIYVSMCGMDPLLFGHEGSDLTYRIINKYHAHGRVIYWPQTVIYHDYPTAEKAGTKQVLHQRSSNYLKFKHNANIFVNRKDIERLPICARSCHKLTAHEDAGWKPAIQTPAKIKTNLRKQEPQVSVVIACHNCEKYLGKCIESILRQTMQEWELFLLDDASNDGTKDIIEKYSQMDERIRPHYFEDNKGPYVRRNFAIERANSEFVVIQDSDDIMHPQKLEKLYNEIKNNNRLGVVGSFYLTALDTFRDMQFCDKIELPVTHRQIMENYNSQLYVCWHGSAIIRKSLFETIGLYDEHPYGSDKFWLAKAAEYARITNRIEFKNIPEYLTYKIEHSSSQQGQLPNLDPRSRRAKFQTYWLYKLMKIREKMHMQPNTDLCAELKSCKCNDYIEKYGHLFEQWENQKLNDDSISIYTIRAVDRFNEGNFVSCIITLESVEKIRSDIAKKMQNYNLLRAMSYYAIDRKEDSLKYLNLEIENHRSPAAMQFLNNGFEQHYIDDVHTWCEKNAGKFDLRVIDTTTCHKLTAHENTTRKNMSQIPLVSVIIPAYNASEYIADAIKSVLTQGYRNFELIIINDGSKDNTEKIILGFKDERIRYISQDNRGLAATHNIGIKQSKGEYVIKLDCDDMITSDFISKHVEQFEKHSEAGLVYCDDYLIDEYANPIRIIERPEYAERNILIRDLFRNGFPVVPFRTCIRKNVFDKIGLFDEQLLVGEDYDMMRRFVMYGLKAVHLKGALYLRRMTGDSLSRKSSEQKAKSHFDVVRRYAETFTHEELFPDINWSKITSEKRRFSAKCLVAETFLSIGQSYIKTSSPPVYAREAFNHAGRELNECLKIDPNNSQIRQLIQKCESYTQNLKKIEVSNDNIRAGSVSVT